MRRHAFEIHGMADTKTHFRRGIYLRLPHHLARQSGWRSKLHKHIPKKRGRGEYGVATASNTRLETLVYHYIHAFFTYSIVYGAPLTKANKTVRAREFEDGRCRGIESNGCAL